MHTELAVFQDRAEAGRVLAQRLAGSVRSCDVVVALPRGGVPVGFQVARSLQAPLDVLSVRKLGVPGHEELAMGAIASDGTQVINQTVVRELGIAKDTLQAVTAARTARAGTPRAHLPGPAATPSAHRQGGDRGRRRPGHRGDHVGGGGRDPPPAAGPGRGRGAGGGRLDLPEAGAGC
jgi:hypothetical protein